MTAAEPLLSMGMRIIVRPGNPARAEATQIEELIPHTTEPSDKEKECSSKRSFYHHDEKMRTPGLQMYGCAWKESLQRYMCRCE